MEFRIHEGARGEWEMLCARWGVAEARRWLASLSVWLRRHNGLPPDAAPDVRDSSVTYWLLYGGVYVEYTVRDHPQPRGWWDLPRRVARRLWGRRRVIFTGFEIPGYPATPEPLPD
jgi:hypothetical protein